MKIDLDILEVLQRCQNGDMTCRYAAELIESYIERSLREKDVSDGFVVVPIEPPIELLTSMAMRQDHSFLAPQHFDSDEDILKARQSDDFAIMLMGKQDKTTREREVTLNEMRKLHEEVVGKGFYKYERKYEKE
jgi:hypothetical protein